MYETCGVRYGSMVYYVVCMGLCLSVRCRRFFDLTFCLDFSGAVCGLKNASCASLLRYFCVSLLLCVSLLVDDVVVFRLVSAGMSFKRLLDLAGITVLKALEVTDTHNIHIHGNIDTHHHYLSIMMYQLIISKLF